MYDWHCPYSRLRWARSKYQAAKSRHDYFPVLLYRPNIPFRDVWLLGNLTPRMRWHKDLGPFIVPPTTLSTAGIEGHPHRRFEGRRQSNKKAWGTSLLHDKRFFCTWLHSGIVEGTHNIVHQQSAVIMWRPPIWWPWSQHLHVVGVCAKGTKLQSSKNPMDAGAASPSSIIILILYPKSFGWCDGRLTFGEGQVTVYGYANRQFYLHSVHWR